ncbi:unnamed protein product [Porites evermanni]|uniref:Uncharacterized protein n=1 Tax=Porites evermanni TaxID=104178 RepID=A0ABN8LVH2_9CNID|nr:unnamed protein product [Porites evermanni]
MAIHGGGFTFLPRGFTRLPYAENIVKVLFRDKKNVLLKLQKKVDRSEAYTLIQPHPSFASTEFGVLINSFQGYTKPLNAFMKEYIFLGIIPASAAARRRSLQGFRSNGHTVHFTNCDANPNSYFAFMPNHNLQTPSNYGARWHIFETSRVAVDWRSKAIPISHPDRTMPNEFFFMTELHFGGCGTYTSSNRWNNSGSSSLNCDCLVRMPLHSHINRSLQLYISYLNKHILILRINISLRLLRSVHTLNSKLKFKTILNKQITTTTESSQTTALELNSQPFLSAIRSYTLHIPNCAEGNCLQKRKNHTLCLKSDVKSKKLQYGLIVMIHKHDRIYSQKELCLQFTNILGILSSFTILLQIQHVNNFLPNRQHRQANGGWDVKFNTDYFNFFLVASLDYHMQKISSKFYFETRRTYYLNCRKRLIVARHTL